MTVNRSSAPGFYLFFFLYFAPGTSSEVPNADNTLDFLWEKYILHDLPLGVLGSFLSFSLLREKLLLIPFVVSRFAISKRFSR
jgi:hypothetical protein